MAMLVEGRAAEDVGLVSTGCNKEMAEGSPITGVVE